MPGVKPSSNKLTNWVKDLIVEALRSQVESELHVADA